MLFVLKSLGIFWWKAVVFYFCDRLLKSSLSVVIRERLGRKFFTLTLL